MVSKDFFIRCLNEQMVVSTGCTEPAAVSYCASIAAEQIEKISDGNKRTHIEKLTAICSKNILKNAMSAGLPNSEKVGVNFATGIGAIHGNPKNKLNVNNDVDKESYVIAEEMIKKGNVKVEVAKVPNVLYVEIIAEGNGHKARAVIADEHTNVTLVELDGKNITSEVIAANVNVAANSVSGNNKNAKLTFDEIAKTLSLKDIYQFATVDLDPAKDPIDILRKAVEINDTISKEGLKTGYGLKVGKSLKDDIEKGEAADNYVNHAIMRATAGSDARMVGAPFGVVTNSGSGNQGITNVMPVLSLAEDLGVSEEKKYRALALGNLTSIYIKSQFGTLSAFCGAAVASTGASAGITYLRGGDFAAYERVIANMIGTVTGMLCDGAKPDCSLKIYAGLQAAFNASNLALKGIRVAGTEGIVCDTTEASIKNMCRLSKTCSDKLDENILDMMINK